MGVLKNLPNLCCDENCVPKFFGNYTGGILSITDLSGDDHYFVAKYKGERMDGATKKGGNTTELDLSSWANGCEIVVTQHLLSCANTVDVSVCLKSGETFQSFETSLLVIGDGCLVTASNKTGSIDVSKFVSGDAVTITAASSSQGGSIAFIDSTLTYTPANGFSGTDVISLSVQDYNGNTATGTLSAYVGISYAEVTPTVVAGSAATIALFNGNAPCASPTYDVSKAPSYGIAIPATGNTITYTADTTHIGKNDPFVVSLICAGCEDCPIDIAVNPSIIAKSDPTISINENSSNADVLFDTSGASESSFVSGTVVATDGTNTITYTLGYIGGVLSVISSSGTLPTGITYGGALGAGMFTVTQGSLVADAKIDANIDYGDAGSAVATTHYIPQTSIKLLSKDCSLEQLSLDFTNTGTGSDKAFTYNGYTVAISDGTNTENLRVIPDTDGAALASISGLGLTCSSIS